MNTASYMDKQIMDLSQSSPPQTKEFIDLMGQYRRPRHEDEDEDEEDPSIGHGGASNGGVNAKKDDILASYDFQPIRPFAGGLSASQSQSSNFDLGGSARAWNSGDSKRKSASPVRNYGSLDSSEPAKFVVEKDQGAFDSAIIAEIDKTMKKHADNLLHALDGVSARLTQLETRTRNLENSVDDMKESAGNNHGTTDGKMRQLENILREVQSGVQVLKDKQDIVEAQLHLAKLQISKADSNHQETPNAAPPVNSAATSQPPPQQIHQHHPPPQHPPFSSPNAPPQPAPQQNPSPANQFPQTPVPTPQQDPYFPPPVQSQDPSNQQYQMPPNHQQLPPPTMPPPQQFPPTPQPPPQQFQPTPQPPPQQFQPTPQPQFPQPPPQLPPHHPSEEPPYPPPFPPASGPPPGQQFYGPMTSHGYEPPPSGRPGSGYGPPPGPNEPYHYAGSPAHFGNAPGMKPQQMPSPTQSGGTVYPQLPTARMLPHGAPAASGGGGSGSAGSGSGGSRVPVDDVIDKVATMGFPRDHVRATVRKLTENGQSVDLNIVLDKLMNEGDGQPPRGWFNR